MAASIGSRRRRVAGEVWPRVAECLLDPRDGAIDERRVAIEISEDRDEQGALAVRVDLERLESLLADEVDRALQAGDRRHLRVALARVLGLERGELPLEV